MSQPTCERCARPMADTAYVCPACAAGLRRALGEVASVAGEHAAAIYRQARLGDGGPGGGEQLPYSPEAAEQTWVAVNTLTTWARHIAEERGLALRPAPGTHPMAWLVGWIVGQLDWLRHRPEAAEAWDELHDACRVAVAAVDRPAARWYAGRCWTVGEDGRKCEQDLYVRTGAETVRCTTCRSEHDLVARKNWLIHHAWETLATADEIARVLAACGYEVTPSMVRGYAYRNRLTARGADGRGRATYRLGDVAELLDEKRNERRVKIPA